MRDTEVPVITTSLPDARRWLADHRPDVISAHGPPEWFLDVAHEYGIPVVETLHGREMLLAANSIAERTRSRHVTAFIAVSELLRSRYLAANSACPPSRIVTVPNAVEAPRGLPDRNQARAWLGLGDEFLFVCLARHSPEKNTFGLVAAFAEVVEHHPSAHLLVAGPVGDWHYAQQVRRQCDRLSIGRSVHLRDHSSHPDRLLAAADGFVLDSFYEGWPLASMEALTAGLPVVMSAVSGASEQLGADGERGHIVANPGGGNETLSWEVIRRMRYEPQPNKAELVDAMVSVVAERGRWAAARPALAAEARSRFDAGQCARRYAEVLALAATSSGSRLQVMGVRA